MAFACLALFSPELWAQEATSLGEEHWDMAPREQVDFENFHIENFKNDPAFAYYEQIADESLWDRIRQWPGKLWDKVWAWILAGEEATGVIAWMLWILPYIAVAGVLVVLVWILANLERDLSSKGSMESTQVRMLAEEDLIHHAAIDQLIEQAIAAGNYPLAIRYYYLQTLQLLTQKGLITWQDQKTNADYIREIPKGKLKDTFARVTLAYDSIWYGNFEVDKLLFSRIVQSFERLKALL